MTLEEYGWEKTDTGWKDIDNNIVLTDKYIEFYTDDYKSYEITFKEIIMLCEELGLKGDKTLKDIGWKKTGRQVDEWHHDYCDFIALYDDTLIIYEQENYGCITYEDLNALYGTLKNYMMKWRD